MVLLVGALTVGLILSLLALGVFVSFRIFEFADITADGSITLGAAVAALLIVHHVPPVWATAAACAAGAVAGMTTGLINTRFGVNRLLSGILVMTALYSINLHVMGKSNVPLLAERTLTTLAEQGGARLAGTSGDLDVFGWALSVRDASMLGLCALAAAGVALLLTIFFRTELGSAMQASGDNAQMIRALGVNVENM